MKKYIKPIVIVLVVLAALLLGPRLLSELLWHRSLDASTFELTLRLSGRDDMKGDADAWFAQKTENNAADLQLPEDMSSAVSLQTHSETDCYILNAQEHSELLIVYFPGGTYIDRPQTEHFEFADRLAAEAGAEVWLLDYPKLPVFNAETAYAQLLELFRDVLAQESYDKLVFMGDSAGGGMALSLANQLTAASLSDTPEMPVPDELILLSPWLDVSMTNDELADYAKAEPKLDRQTLAAAGEAWAGTLGTTDGTVSPLYAEPVWLAADAGHQLTLFAGTRELLYPDIVRFSEQLKADALGHQLILGEGMNHIWPLYLSYGIPEAQDTFEQILRLLAD